MTTSSPTTKPSQRLAVTVLLLTLARLVTNIPRRFPYPFLPEISRQLGVSLTDVQQVMAVNSGIGLTSPVFGPLSERFGRKRVMMGALALMASASAVGALAPRFSVFAVLMIVLGLGKILYDPAMHAYIGDRVPYARRGAAVGATELSWALSLVVAAPVAGYLFATAGLYAIFAGLVVAFVAAFVGIWVFVPPDYPQGERPPLILPWTALRMIRGNRSAVGAVTYTLLLTLANELFFINYSGWMETSFGLVPTALGTVSIVIGAAEVCGEFAVIGLADRMGKRRLALIGAFVSALGYGLLPVVGVSLPIALIGVFVLFVSFETAIVGAIPLLTEVMPNARSVMLSGNIAAGSIGRMSGAVLGGALFALTGSFVAVGLITAIVGLGAALALWRFVAEHESESA